MLLTCKLANTSSRKKHANQLLLFTVPAHPVADTGLCAAGERPLHHNAPAQPGVPKAMQPQAEVSRVLANLELLAQLTDRAAQAASEGFQDDAKVLNCSAWSA